MPSSHYRTELRRWTPFFLFALNLFLSWRLLNLEYTTHYKSIEPFFYALAAHLRAHWLQPGWWGTWNCGMPFRYTYQPGLHSLVALTSALTGWNTARAFHFTFALLYSAGPVTLYLLVRRLAGSFRIALAAGLLYSLWSPSTWLVRDLAQDTGGAFHATLRFGQQYAGYWAFTFDPGGLLNARRLHAAVAYGDSPYVTGLTFVPLAVLLVHKATQRTSPLNLFLAALGLVAVPLTNIPATLTLAMMLLAYVLATPPGEHLRRLFVIAFCSFLGYLLAAPLIPLSALLLAARNTQWMDQQGQITPVKLLWITLGLLLLFGIVTGLRRLRVSEFARFSIAFLLVTATIVLGKAWGNFSVIAQPMRFHLGLEMAIVACVASLAGVVHVRARWARIAIATLSVAAVGWQIESYHLYARHIVKREPIWERSEYKIAKWMDQHAGGNRVWVPGSVSFWLNTFTNTPQMTGCCDQNFLFQAPRIATYEMGTDDGAGARAGEISLVWMKTMGVKYFALSGPHSTEEYGVTHHPKKFTGMLESRWHNGDDAIYEVPGPPGSLAHWIQSNEAIRQMPVNGVEVEPIRNYAAAVTDPARPQASFEWQSTASALVRGAPRLGDLLSVQIPFHFGWRAESAKGVGLKIGQDALGFMLIDPHCNGDCAIRLIFDGGWESRVLLWLSLFAWTATAIVLLRAYRQQ